MFLAFYFRGNNTELFHHVLQVKQILLFYGVCSKTFKNISQETWTNPPDAPLFYCFSVKVNTLSTKKVQLVANCMKWSRVLWTLSETFLNQNQLSSIICYRKLLNQIYPHILVMDMLRFPQIVISMFTFAQRCDQYTLRKSVRDFFT